MKRKVKHILDSVFGTNDCWSYFYSLDVITIYDIIHVIEYKFQ